MGTVSSLLILLLVPFGIVFIVIGIIVRKFWPHKRGSLNIWFISFEMSEWLSFIIEGAFLLAITLFFICLGV